MFETLPASRSKPAPVQGWTFGSIATHTILVGVAIALTQKAQDLASEPHVEPLFYVPVAVQPRPVSPENFVPPSLSDIPSPVIALPNLPQLPSATFDPKALGITRSEVGNAALTTPTPTAPTNGIYTQQFVDRTVVPRADNSSPAYPRQMRMANVEGEVLVRFVVDTSGRVEPGSIAILSASHLIFGDAVREWLRRTRYEPAQLRSQRVRQLVQQQIEFTLR
jgi:TonB family protein